MQDTEIATRRLTAAAQLRSQTPKRSLFLESKFSNLKRGSHCFLLKSLIETAGHAQNILKHEQDLKKISKITDLMESAFINAETRGLTHRIIWCNISKKLERRKLNEKYNELH